MYNTRTKKWLKYVKIRLTQFIIYKHSLTNKYRKLVNVIVSCFHVYMAKQAVDCRNMVRVKVWHTHTAVWLVKNYSQRILTYCTPNTRILLGGHWLVRMVGVSTSVNLPLHHKVQKFSCGTGSPGWSRKKGRETFVCVYMRILLLVVKYV